MAKESTCKSAMETSQVVVADTSLDCPVLQKLGSSSVKKSATRWHLVFGNVDGKVTTVER